MLVKTVFLGVIFFEVWVFFWAFAETLIERIITNNYESAALAFAVFYVFILVFYLITRGFFGYGFKLVKSKRFDILIALFIGIYIGFLWGGFFTDWCAVTISLLSLWQLLVIAFIPALFVILFIGKAFLKRREDPDSILISDEELQSKKDDLLNFAKRADKFAERVYNNGSSKSFVFGVDAPWGIGKSTFINFCKEYWDEKYEKDILVYKFNPLRYAGDANLLDVFVNGLIQTIQKDSFVPEIRPLISRYSRLLREVSRFSFLGFNIPNFTTGYGVEDAFDDLSVVLSHFNKKVIIIVDDLDRMEFSEIKNVLFTIRKSFILPNVSYVLCYDTNNIGTLEAETPDVEKIDEFLEKFINIKISLFLDQKDLSKYVSENLEIILSDSLVDPILVRQTVGGLLDIYKSPKYHNYLPFIGDIRKLKRLINTAILFELHTTDFKTSDFDKHDLIHLLLIYIHYPNIFRKIYDTETNGNRGFFSVVMPYDDDYPEDKKESGYDRGNSTYKNSESYDRYLKELENNKGGRFLLEQVFNLSDRIEDCRVDSVPPEVRTSLACFNGGWTNGRNLEDYLNLIVNLSKPIQTEQHKFYVDRKDEILNETKTLDEVFMDEEFTYNEGEGTREQLWRIIINNARMLKSKVAGSVITHLLDNIHTYSLLEIKEGKKIYVGLRNGLSYFLTRLLNDSGWNDVSGKRSHNTPENIKEIAEWIFGEGRHEDDGILKKLSHPDRGLLGLHDLMMFRLFCNADRGGDIFNLTTSLSKHGDKNALTDGDLHSITLEEMREISQKIFHIFKKQYIDAEVNIFVEAEKLQLSDVASACTEYVENKIKEKIIQKNNIDIRVETLKTRITSFIIYQIGNDFIDHGVGCGKYDPTGNEDNCGIKKKFNEYLFNFCFNPENEKRNYEYFLDYLFENYIRVFVSEREDDKSYVPRISEFTKALDKEKLTEYWRTNADIVKDLNLTKKEKEIHVGDYIATYKNDLEKLFKTLDNLVIEEDQRLHEIKK